MKALAALLSFIANFVLAYVVYTVAQDSIPAALGIMTLFMLLDHDSIKARLKP